jgi:predicted  nucleic acid-binding Zn-ribbon protein
MAGNNRNLSGVNNDMNIDSLTEKRLWQTLDGINEKLTGIESKLIEVVRLEEKVNQHDDTLRRFGGRLDKQESRMHESELWQAHQGDKSSVERLITNVQTELQDLNKELDDVRKTQHVNTGQKDISKEVLKWIVGILGAILVFKFTRG